MATKIVKDKFFIEDKEVETISEVNVEQDRNWNSNNELKFIGKEIPRIDGFVKVTGKAVYTSDMITKDTLHGYILRSPYPNANIVNIDISEAKKVEGVSIIYTNENFPQIKWYDETSFVFDKQVRYEGDEVALIIANELKIAQAAAKLIKVNYHKLPFVISAIKAKETDSPKVHPWGNALSGKAITYSRGNTDEGFKNSDIIVEDEFSTSVVIQNPTEPHCSFVYWEGDKLIIYDSTQGIFSVRDEVANALGMSKDKVRVIKKFMGGGFGSKLEAGKYTVMAAIASKELKKSIKIVLDRKEQNMAVGNRPDSVQTLKAGLKKDGTILALSHNSTALVGAYPEGGGCAWPLRSMYKCDNVNVEEWMILGNTGRARAFRAPGHVQGTFALESLIDECAEKVGLDPIEFRLKNYTEIDQDSKNPYTTKKLKEAYKKGAELIGWENRKKVPGSDKGSIKRGIGMASQIWWGGGGPPAHANMKISKKGEISVYSGTQDLGTGTYTFIAMIVAEVLEVPINQVKVIIGDTELCPYAPLSGGSMTAPSVSPAVRDAAEQMKVKLIQAAASISNKKEDEIEYSNGQLNAGAKNLSIVDIMKELKLEELETKGSRNQNPNGYSVNTFGAQFAEVEVDTLTGKIKVIKIAAVHDIGRVLNKETIENQMHGGILQGLGFALMEERIMDEGTGKLLSNNLHSYKIPTMLDVPEIVLDFSSDYDPLLSSTGVKGVGEPAIIPTAGAIANAVYNALGVRLKSLPLTPDKVLSALYSK